MSDGREVLSRSAPAADLTLRYGDLPDQVADIRLPTTGDGPRPLVLVVHGGFWTAEFDRTHAGPQSAGLAAAGYVVATVDFRRIGTGGGWPATFDDVAALTDSVPALVADALTDRVDHGRTVLVGHSAGGHLAAWATARHRLPLESPWHRDTPLDAAVVSLAGVLDLELSERLGLGEHAAKRLLGGSPRRRPDRYALADPAALLPSRGRLVAVHGARDDIVPIELSRRYVELASAAGDVVELLEIPDCGHFDLIDPLSRAWPAVLDAIAKMITVP